MLCILQNEDAKYICIYIYHKSVAANIFIFALVYKSSENYICPALALLFIGSKAFSLIRISFLKKEEKNLPIAQDQDSVAEGPWAPGPQSD